MTARRVDELDSLDFGGVPGVDLNLVVIMGTLAVDGELKQFDSGSRLIRYLVTVRVATPRRRVDVIPVTLWDPSDELWQDAGNRGDRIWVTGALQRRYWESPDGRRSRMELTAEQIRVVSS